MLSCSFLSFTILSLIVSKRYFLFDFILSIMRLVKAAEPSNSWPKIWWPMQRCRTQASCPGARDIIEATPCMHAQQYLAQNLVAHADAKHRLLAQNLLGILHSIGSGRRVTLRTFMAVVAKASSLLTFPTAVGAVEGSPCMQLFLGTCVSGTSVLPALSGQQSAFTELAKTIHTFGVYTVSLAGVSLYVRTVKSGAKIRFGPTLSNQ